MHHLFLVHSEITRLVARRVVECAPLDPARCRFVLLRGYAPAASERVRTVAKSWSLRPETFPRRRNAIGCFRRLAAFDREIAELTGGEAFQLYTPQTHQRFHQALRRHPRCAGFSFLEEGLNSYCTRDEIERTHPIQRVGRWDRLCHRGRIGDAHFFDRGHAHAYAVTEHAFPGLDGRVVLPDVLAAAAASPPGCRDVLVFDALSTYRRVRLESVLDALAETFRRLAAEGVERVHYKYHPAQIERGEAAEIEPRLAALAAPVQLTPLAAEASLEGMAYADPTLRFVVNLSSAGFYAALLGCRARSFAKLVAAVEPDFQRSLDETPRVFRERVEFFDPA
jgi:hypothetical protein